MPNTLAHLGVQGILSRACLRDADPRWVALGCVVPDVPWIANRVLLFAFPSIDEHELRLYVIAQASLLCSLLLCGALAAFAQRWRPVLLVLAANALLHLLLDACETKWGNGVLLLAPWSWHPWNLELFWPESVLVRALTLVGLGFGLWAVCYSRRHPAPRAGRSRRRWIAALVLLLAYLAVPALLRDGPENADSNSVRTLHEPANRAGSRVALDRAWLRRLDDGRVTVALGGDEIAVVGATLDHSARVSVKGRFLDRDTLLVEELHEHVGWSRDVASYLGLGLVAATWVAGLALRRESAA